jgi:molybdopterin-guanine dinucleotide biosynthesis protein A
MSANPDVSAFILAGGKSSRMGADKAFVTLNGRTLLQRALDVTRAVTPNVRIVGVPQKFTPFAPVVEDIFPGCGPLAGIHAALRASDTELNFILAVDLPFVPADLLHFLLASALDSSCTLTVPRIGERWQPLCAVYRRSFADLAEPALRASRYRIDRLFAETQIQIIAEDELQSAGFSAELFRNLNTPDELADALHSSPR